MQRSKAKKIRLVRGKTKSSQNVSIVPGVKLPSIGDSSEKEMKMYYQTFIAQSAVAGTQKVFDIDTLAQGLTNITRIGSSITVHKIALNLSIRSTSSFGNRITLVQDMDGYDGIAPVNTDTTYLATWGGVPTLNQRNFKVLMDTFLSCQPNGYLSCSDVLQKKGLNVRWGANHVSSNDLALFYSSDAASNFPTLDGYIVVYYTDD